MDSQLSTDVSDYVAALKRRRLLLASISVPIAASRSRSPSACRTSIRLTALIEFSQARSPVTCRNARPAAEELRGPVRLQPVGRRAEREEPAADASPIPQVMQGGKRGNRSSACSEQHERRDGARARCSIRTRAASARWFPRSRSTYESRDPNEAQQGAKWLTNAFLQASRGNLQERAVSSAQFFSVEADRYREQIAQLEAKLADFKAKNFGQLPESADMNMNIDGSHRARPRQRGDAAAEPAAGPHLPRAGARAGAQRQPRCEPADVARGAVRAEGSDLRRHAPGHPCPASADREPAPRRPVARQHDPAAAAHRAAGDPGADPAALQRRSSRT